MKNEALFAFIGSAIMTLLSIVTLIAVVVQFMGLGGGMANSPAFIWLVTNVLSIVAWGMITFYFASLLNKR